MMTSCNSFLQWRDFAKRFGGFSDTVLMLVQINPDPTVGYVQITLRSRDLFTPQQDLWRVVILRFEGVESFSFAQPNRTAIVVISFGIHALFEDDRVGMEFEFPSPPDDWEELQKSPVHVIAKRLLFSWEL